MPTRPSCEGPQLDQKLLAPVGDRHFFLAELTKGISVTPSPSSSELAPPPHSGGGALLERQLEVLWDAVQVHLALFLHLELPFVQSCALFFLHALLQV